jgi:hypothetical protein
MPGERKLTFKDLNFDLSLPCTDRDIIIADLTEKLKRLEAKIDSLEYKLNLIFDGHFLIKGRFKKIL